MPIINIHCTTPANNRDRMQCAVFVSTQICYGLMAQITEGLWSRVAVIALFSVCIVLYFKPIALAMVFLCMAVVPE